MTSAHEKKALEGIRVYDASQGIAGPYASMLLALHGAEVFKIEPPSGDWSRQLGRNKNAHSIDSIAVNRYKKSIALDIKSESGKQIATKLIASSQLFIESFRPGIAQKLGLGYEDIKKINPTIIYISISGFGQSGPYSERPCVDGLIQAYTGMMYMNKAADGKPHRIGMVAADVLTGLYAYQAISSALIRQIRFNVGAYLDINLAQSVAAFQAAKIMEFVESKGKPAPLYIPSAIFSTADGYIFISGMRERHFLSICKVVNRDDIAQDPRWQTPEDRIAHAAEIHAELQKELLLKNTSYWLKKLHAEDVMAEAVRSYEEWLNDIHTSETNAFELVSTSLGSLPITKVPGVLPHGDNTSESIAPAIGQHTTSILKQMGFSKTWIDEQLKLGHIIQSEVHHSS